jgi:hypothetical protein
MVQFSVFFEIWQKASADRAQHTGNAANRKPRLAAGGPENGW